LDIFVYYYKERKMNVMKDNIMDDSSRFKVAKWWYIPLIIFVVVVILVLAIIVFTLEWSSEAFNNSGQIGDTIGGITAPFIGILGAILIFYSFMAQVYANKIMMKFNQKSMSFNKQIEKFNKMIVEHNELNNIRNLISETIEDYRNFKFRSKYDDIVSNTTSDINDISGRDAVRRFIKSIHQILSNNINSGGAFRDDFVDGIFVDGIHNNSNHVLYLFETIGHTLETIRNSELFINKNPYCMYSYNKLIRYLNVNLFKHRSKFNDVENKLLPEVISLCEKGKINISKPIELLEIFKKINCLLENLFQNKISNAN
jgi:hypothetical protein